MDDISIGVNRPKFREEANRSWWLDADTRESFQQAAEREAERMARSRGALLARGITIGWGVSGRKP